MRRTILVVATIVALACKVEKTGQDTYKVVAPTPEAKAAAEKAKEQAKEAGEKLKAGTAEELAADEQVRKVYLGPPTLPGNA